MLNIGVVGCGYWGPNHVRNYHELAEANLTVVCDINEDRLRQVRTKYPYVKTTPNFEDLLKNSCDAIVLATPVNTHHRLAKEAMLHGKHILIEKPMAANSEEVLELIEIAEKQNLVLMVGHTYEYHPAVNFLREVVNSGELGEIYAIDSDRLNLGLFRPDVNVLWDLAPHDISIILSLLNEEPVAVSARGTHHRDPSVCDVAYLELLFCNGTMAHIHVSWLHPRKIRQVTIVGNKKMLVYDDISENEKIHIYDKGLSIPDDGNDKFSAWPPNYRYGDVVIPFISNAEPLKLECSHFVECIIEGKRPRSDGWSGLRVTSILEAADKSLSNGGKREKLHLATAAIAESATTTIS